MLCDSYFSKLQFLAIAKFLVARDNDTVAGVETFDDFVVLRILATEANISASSPFTIRIHHIDPSSACGLEECATRDKQCLF